MCKFLQRKYQPYSAKLLNLILDSTYELECDLTCNKVESVSRTMLFALHIIREQTLHKLIIPG